MHHTNFKILEEIIANGMLYLPDETLLWGKF